MWSLSKFIENKDQTIVFDNEALYELCFRYLKLTTPSFQDLNFLISQAMSEVTSMERFPNILNSNLHKTGINLIPFPKLHFLITSLAPLMSRSSSYCSLLTCSQLVERLFQRNSLSFNFISKDPSFLTAVGIFQGRLDEAALNNQINEKI